MKKKAKKKDKKSQGVSPKTDSTVKQEEEKTFDFGGLPNRDLKKNLGCG